MPTMSGLSVHAFNPRSISTHRSTTARGLKLSATARVLNLNSDLDMGPRRMLDVMVEMSRRNGGRERAVSLRGKSFGFFCAVHHPTNEELGERGDDEVLAFRAERRKGGAVDESGKALSANLVVVSLQKATVIVDLQRVQELKRTLIATKQAIGKEANIKREKEKGPGAKLRKDAAKAGKTILAGFHALVELSGCHVTLSTLAAHQSWPLTLSNQGLVVHNRAQRGEGAWGGFGSPLSLGIRGRQGQDGNGIPGVDELVRARESQQLVLAELEALETKFAVGPLRTVEAAVESTPGDHIHELTRMQMGDYLSELQRARRRIAEALFHSAAQPPNTLLEPKRRQGEMTLGDVQKSVAYTRLCLQELKSVMDEDRGEDDEEGDARGFDFQVSEDCKLSLGVDGHEMMEMFDAFCDGPHLQNEYGLLFGDPEG